MPAPRHLRRRGDASATCDRRCRRPSPRRAGSIAFARPKSSTFTVPSARTLMFAGFRSRWMIPCSCAASSASAICFAIGSASSSRHRAARDALRQVLALDEFHHQRGDAAGFLRARRSRRCADGSARRASCASRVNRARRSASCANASGRTLIATSRSSFVSRARKTAPMPPSPSLSRTLIRTRACLPISMRAVARRLRTRRRDGPELAHSRRARATARPPTCASISTTAIRARACGAGIA